MVRKAWDKCSYFQCKRKTFSKAKEADPEKRFCGYHMPGRNGPQGICRKVKLRGCEGYIPFDKNPCRVLRKCELIGPRCLDLNDLFNRRRIRKGKCLVPDRRKKKQEFVWMIKAVDLYENEEVYLYQGEGWSFLRSRGDKFTFRGEALGKMLAWFRRKSQRFSEGRLVRYYPKRHRKNCIANVSRMIMDKELEEIEGGAMRKAFIDVINGKAPDPDYSVELEELRGWKVTRENGKWVAMRNVQGVEFDPEVLSGYENGRVYK